MAAEAVMALQTITARNLSPRSAAVVTMGVIRGGERFNIIPDRVQLEGTVRTYSQHDRDLIERRMAQILDGVASAHGGSADLDYRRATPVGVNDPALAARLLPTLRAALGDANLIDQPPSMGGEDFAFFAERVPGFYFRLGSCAPGTLSGGLHTPTLRADDATVPLGMRLVSALVLDFLASP
jgi:amidohydrolase